jgi:hypothetical protein
MEMSWALIFWVFAFVLFVVSAFVNPPRANLMAIGLAFLTMGFIAQATT